MTVASAIRNRQLLSFTYAGFVRTVEPYTLGIDSKGHEALRAFQVGGGSKSGETIGWKFFHVREMRNLAVLATQFSRPRPDYVRGDPAFRVIHAEV